MPEPHPDHCDPNRRVPRAMAPWRMIRSTLGDYGFSTVESFLMRGWMRRALGARPPENCSIGALSVMVRRIVATQAGSR